LKSDLLNHPEYIEQNATLAFQAAIWRWVTPIKKSQPSAHDAFVGNWKPTKNDTLSKRVPGFGTTMNILYGDFLCGKGDDESMNTIISHYLYYLDLMGLSREQAGPNEALSCAEQAAFNPTKSPNTASSWALFDGIVGLSLFKEKPLIRVGKDGVIPIPRSVIMCGLIYRCPLLLLCRFWDPFVSMEYVLVQYMYHLMNHLVVLCFNYKFVKLKYVLFRHAFSSQFGASFGKFLCFD
jgi:hypothetical protein